MSSGVLPFAPSAASPDIADCHRTGGSAASEVVQVVSA